MPNACETFEDVTTDSSYTGAVRSFYTGDGGLEHSSRWDERNEAVQYFHLFMLGIDYRLLRVRNQFEAETVIKTEAGEYVLSAEGYHTFKRKTFGDLCDFVRENTLRETIDGRRFDDVVEGGLSFKALEWGGLSATDALPVYRWCAVYAVTGGSEGHYIHVDLLVDTNKKELERIPLALGKTFEGLDAAYRACAILAELLDV